MTTYKTAKGILDRTLKTPYFTKSVIPYHRVEGKGPLVVVIGENASGKSFLRRVIGSVCMHFCKPKIEFMGLSMEGRRNTSFNPWMTFVYGDESYESTGVNSVDTVLTGIETCRKRETPHVIFWDEPDLGLSEGYAAGLGEKIRDFAIDPPKHTVAAFIVTHRRALVEALLPANPTLIYLGEEGPATLQEWVEAPIQAKDPSKLKHASRERSKAIKRVLDQRKK